MITQPCKGTVEDGVGVSLCAWGPPNQNRNKYYNSKFSRPKLFVYVWYMYEITQFCEQ